MKKFLFTLTAIGISQLTIAQTRTSVANGNATNPLTWDCLCVPLPGNDIIINHAVVLDNDFGYTSGSVTINASGSLVGNVPSRAFALSGTGTFTNHGTFEVGDFYHGGTTLLNNGDFHVLNVVAIDAGATATNNGDFDVDDTLYININSTLNNTGTANAPYTASAGTITNTGGYTGYDMYNSGIFNNNGGTGVNISNNFLSSGTVSNGAKLDVGNDLFQSETFTNNNHIVVVHDMWSGDTINGTATLTNNGTISVGNDFANSEDLNGSGKFCIAMNSANSGNVTGTLDICDLSGTDFDYQFGTVAGTVTYCAVPCVLSIDQQEETANAVIYPNPFNNQLTVNMHAAGQYRLVILNALGQVVSEKSFNGGERTFDMSQLKSGWYVYRISGGTQTVSGKIIKN